MLQSRALTLLPAFLALTLSARAQGPITVDGVLSVAAPERAALLLELDPTRVYPGQRVQLRAKILMRQDLVESTLLQLFRRELDLEAQLLFPDLSGWTPSPAGPGLRYALGDTVDRLQGPKPAELPSIDQPPRPAAAALLYQRSWWRTVARNETLEVPAARLRFAYTTGFRGDLLAGSVPTDRVEAYVQSGPARLEVLPFPEEGRPVEFRGDLGTYRLTSQALPASVKVGEAFPWSVRIAATTEGSSDLALPPYPPAPGIRLLDTQSETDDRGVLLTWTVEATRAGTRELPPIILASFDPRPPGTYVVASTPAVSLQVLPQPGGQAPGNPKPQKQPDAGAKQAAGVGLAALGVLVLWIWRTRRSRRAS